MSTQEIYTGVWRDRSQSTSVLTLSAGDAQVLTAFLGFLIPLVGVQLWKILAFCTHQYLSPNGRDDTLRQQLLVALRNNSGAGGSTWTFLKQAWAWKDHSRRALYRCMSWVAIASIYGILLAVLATFLPSLISDAGYDTRLLTPTDDCGYFQFGEDENYTKWMNDTVSAANYARDCYGGSESLKCNGFAVPQLPRLAGESVSCPFSNDVCLGDYDAYFMDSGYLDSLTDFGINFDSDERVKFRKTATCALLAQDGFTKDVDDGTGFYYGEAAGGPLYDYTFHQPDALSDFPSAKYRLESVSSFEGGTASWDPISPLQQDDGDLSLLFLAAQGMLFRGEVDDPLFRAHKQPNSDRDIYRADNAGQAIACVDRYELCNPEEDECTGPTNANRLEELRKDSDLDLSDEQMVIAGRFTRPAGFALQMAQVVFGRGGSALQASLSAVENVQNPLPDDQWKRELDGWFDTSLARLQREVQDFAAPKSGAKSGDSPVELDDDQAEMCDRQVVKGDARGGSVNYRLVPLIVVIILCGLILLLSLVLEHAVALLQRLSHKGLRRREDWVQHGKFQLQREVLSSTGVQGWRNVDRSVPWTRSNIDGGSISEERPHVDPKTGKHNLMTDQALLGDMESRDPSTYQSAR